MIDLKLLPILKEDKLSLSFEVFPPKTDTAFENVKAAVETIAELRPAFMSVTYGAGGGTSQYTLDIAPLSSRETMGISKTKTPIFTPKQRFE